MSVGQSGRVMGKGFNCRPLDNQVPTTSGRWTTTKGERKRAHIECTHTHRHLDTRKVKRERKRKKLVGAKLKDTVRWYIRIFLVTMSKLARTTDATKALRE